MVKRANTHRNHGIATKKPVALIARFLGLILMTIMVGWPGVASARADGQHPLLPPTPKESNKMRFVFEAASQAMLIGESLAPAWLLDHVARMFPTPTVLGNAGLARAMHAVALQGKQEPQCVYPWLLDTVWRAEDRETVRRTVPASRGTKWAVFVNLVVASSYASHSA